MQKEELETQRLFLEQQTALMKEQQQLMTKDLNVTLQRDFDRGFRDLIDIVETKSHHIQEMFARINQTRTSPHHACMYFLLEQSSLSYSIERFRKNLILDLEANSFLSSLCSLVHYIDTDSRYLGNFHRSLLQAKIASAHWQAVILYLIYIGDDYGFSTINTIQRYALAHRHLSSKFLEYLHTLCPEAFDILAVAADESATAKVL